MKFNEKLKQAMQQLGISQAQVVGMTGIVRVPSVSTFLARTYRQQKDRRTLQCHLVLKLIILKRMTLQSGC